MKKKTVAILLMIVYFVTITYIYFAPVSLERFGTGSDKVFHFLVFFFGGIIFIAFNFLKVSRRYIVVLIILLFLAPFLLEQAQNYVSYRVYDPIDMLYNYAGLVTPIIPYGIYIILKKIISDRRSGF